MKRFKRSTVGPWDGHIRAMLIMQGYNEAKDLTAEERVSILGRWKAVEVKTGRRKK